MFQHDFKGGVFGLFRWQWKAVALYTITSVAVVSIHEFTDWTHIKLPALPLGIIGGALGIFVSFRTNSSYARWWEGRKLWGRLINTSRHWCTQVLVYLPKAGDGPSDTQSRMVRRHIAYVHVLRCLLRGADPLHDEEVGLFLRDDDRARLQGSSNATHALLQAQMEDVVALQKQGDLDEFRVQSLDLSVRHLLDIQGGCERIKKTPLPRGYSNITELLVQVFSILFPLAAIEPLGWAVIPVNIIVCMAFMLISEVGRVLEDPFTMFWPALPLSALSRTIEINLVERLGTETPREQVKPIVPGVLM